MSSTFRGDPPDRPSNTLGDLMDDEDQHDGEASHSSPGTERASSGGVSTTVVLYAAAALILVAGLIAVVVSGVRQGPSVSAGAVASEKVPVTPEVLPISLSGSRQFTGPTYGVLGLHATGDKPQSKVWYAGKHWWSVQIEASTQSTHIAKWLGTRWQDTGVAVDSRPDSLSDVVWQDDTLYIASRTKTEPALLRRYTFGEGHWMPKDFQSFPITTAGTRTLSIAVDSQRRIWAVFLQAGQIRVTHSQPDGTVFSPAAVLPGPNEVQPDDTAAVIAVKGQVAVLWSDQVRSAFRFVIRKDDAPVDQWRVTKPAATQVRIADGHIKLQAAADGTIYAAIKTSLGDKKFDAPKSPMLELLVRSPSGTWVRHVAARTSDQMTRPQILLSKDGRTLFWFASSPSVGGNIYVKVVDTDNITFSPGRGTPLLHHKGDQINDATVARQPVSPSTGVLVLASDRKHGVYHTGFIPFTRR